MAEFSLEGMARNMERKDEKHSKKARGTEKKLLEEVENKESRWKNRKHTDRQKVAYW